MKKLALFSIIAIALMIGGSAQAFTYHYDALDAVSTSPFDDNNNTAPIEYPHGVGYLPSPGPNGEGGEMYDIEGFNVTFESGFMYLSLTNSMGFSTTSPTYGSTFRMGDLFFGSDNNPYMYGIDLSEGDLYQVSAWNQIQNDPGSYYDNTTIRTRVGAFEIADGQNLGSANQVHSFWEGYESDPLLPDNTDGDTHVFEWKVDMSLLNWDWQGSDPLFFHATTGCGNDLMEYELPAIPEPTTMVLLGIGVLGAGIISRKK